mgnify:CR=1 FL=1
MCCCKVVKSAEKFDTHFPADFQKNCCSCQQQESELYSNSWQIIWKCQQSEQSSNSWQEYERL